MARKLKVFRTAIGFHDAYVAAPSRKAALAAWGTDKDLFARGAAEEVTDPALAAAPLARPGEVIRLSRGGTREQIAALGKAPRPAKRAAKSLGSSAPPEEKPRPLPPRPSRTALDQAEAALERLRAKHDAARKRFTARKAALLREEQAMIDAQRSEDALAQANADEVRETYETAMEAWRES
jgi:hypothetical protein